MLDYSITEFNSAVRRWERRGGRDVDQISGDAVAEGGLAEAG
jgi:hypothetical protein